MSDLNPISATLSGILDLQRGTARDVTLAKEDRLDGKTALITGANSGLGKATAVMLAQRGARVVMACRSGIPQAGDAVREAARSEAVQMMPVDLADPASIAALCDGIAARPEPLDVVVCNAGVMPRTARRTPAGFEWMFAVNYLANVLLLRRLLADQSLRQSGSDLPRIVIVSSDSHRRAAPLDFERIGDFVDYGLTDGIQQYAHTKLLLCTFAVELSRRLLGSAEVHCLCPGAVASNIAREAPGWSKPLLAAVFRLFFSTPEKAAKPVVYLSCAAELAGQTGVYLHRTAIKRPSDAALEPDNGARLWEVNEKLVARVGAGF